MHCLNTLLVLVHRFVLLLFSISDDIKACYTDVNATICGAPWEELFKVRDAGLK